MVTYVGIAATTSPINCEDAASVLPTRHKMACAKNFMELSDNVVSVPAARLYFSLTHRGHPFAPRGRKLCTSNERLHAWLTDMSPPSQSILTKCEDEPHILTIDAMILTLRPQLVLSIR